VSYEANIKALPSASHAIAVDVSSADQALAPTARYLYVGVSGDVKVDMEDSGTAIVFKAAPVGPLYVRAVKVYHTGTTATNIVALW
jgi:hypothetical protein